MTVELDLVLDDLSQDKGEELFVVGCLMNVLPEALMTRIVSTRPRI